MTEPQFTYGAFTLDELRSLAASPQVGTMQAMPASFRALADRVGEVADLLSHTQADLPNWWKGTAAEQAAATLGRAAAEAREFHGSALAAASAVGRCTQVVAEQQHQMMNIPELPEPGVTAVVQRPKTPFEALQAARQDARYQAAHEQAVQVVNGIAAQYVETRNALSDTHIMFGEDFTPIKDSPSPTLTTSNSHEASPSPTAITRTEAQQFAEPRLRQLKTTERVSGSTYEQGGRSTNLQPKNTPDPDLARRENTAASSVEYPAGSSINSASLPVSHTSSKPAQDVESELPAVNYVRSTDGKLTPVHLSNKISSTDRLQQGSTETESAEAGSAVAGQRRPATAMSPARDAHLPASTVDEASPTAAFGSNHLSQITNADAARPDPQITRDSTLDESANATAAMIPPCSGMGSIHRTHKERSPRPAYLKERKSVWLSDTIAAPPDGVVGPGYFDEH